MNEVSILKDKEQNWKELIKAQVQSGQSVRVFCEERGLKWYTFYFWKQKLRRAAPLAEGRLPASSWEGAQRFIPIPRTIHLAVKTPRIHLPNGVQIELGAGLESGAVSQFIRSLCGVSHAKP